MNKPCLLLALALLAGCGDDPPKPAPVPTPPVAATKPQQTSQTSKPNTAPPLTEVQKAEMQKVVVSARELVKQARGFKKQGDGLLKSGGPQAANDTYVKARDLFRKALDMTEDWTEPELGKVTEAQVKDHLQDVVNERAAWTKENAEMGKLHKD